MRGDKLTSEDFDTLLLSSRQLARYSARLEQDNALLQHENAELNKALDQARQEREEMALARQQGDAAVQQAQAETRAGQEFGQRELERLQGELDQLTRRVGLADQAERNVQKQLAAVLGKPADVPLPPIAVLLEELQRQARPAEPRPADAP